MVRELYIGYYRHFKDLNNDFDEMVYYVHNICEDTETGEIKVFYQALYGDMKYYVREINMFLSLVDRDKYPLSIHKYRFRRMSDQEVIKWKRRNKKIVKKLKKQKKDYFKSNKLGTVIIEYKK